MERMPPARAALDAGPSAWKPEDIDRSRCPITDVVGDLRCPRALLAPDGGWHFDGYDLGAPEPWRRDGAST